MPLGPPCAHEQLIAGDPSPEPRRLLRCLTALTLAVSVTIILSLTPAAGQEEPWFRSGVELVNITATVTDRSGRFVPGLVRTDFRVFEDDRPVEVTHFSVDRVPVSLGIVLDTSESMAGDKMAHARAAIERFLDRLEPGDEVFLWGFASDVDILQDWTTNRDVARASLQRIDADGATAMYDAVARAVLMAQSGRNRKNALVLISDGNDTTSRSNVRDVLKVVRETDVLVYAVGIDGDGKPGIGVRLPLPRPTPIPFPLSSRPVSGLPGPLFSQAPALIGPLCGPDREFCARGRIAVHAREARQIDAANQPAARRASQRDIKGEPLVGWMRRSDRLNVSALREITDESGGRTEAIRRARDLGPATESIADELSRQYSLGYTSPGYRDGQWHTIRVAMADRSLRVRARRGYFAVDEAYACILRCD